MCIPNKHTPKITTILCTVALFLFAEITSADTLPTEEVINSLAENAKLTADTFMQQSFKLRMQYEYSGKFLTGNDKENLHELAKSASGKLQTITKKLETLKQQIEDYQGDDWDQRYGTTGLWRKLYADIYATKLSKFKIDYYLALASEHSQRDQILHSILSEIDALAQSNKQFRPNLTRGKTLALLAQTEQSYKDAAVKELETFAEYSDTYRPTAAEIEQMKLLRNPDVNHLNVLVKRLQSNWNDKYLELILSLMFLQRQYDPEAFEKTISLWPQTKDFIAFLVLSDLSNQIEKQQNLQQISIFEAELAALAARKDETKNYKKLLSYLSNTEKFQTPLILYITATTLAESSPTEAVNLLIEASKLQQQNSNELNIESSKIAEQAARLSYSLYTKQKHHALILKAFDNYSAITNGEMDNDLEYFYTLILSRNDQLKKSEKLLQKIAARPGGKFRNRAKLDLITRTIRNIQKPDSELLNQLRNVMADCAAGNEQQLLTETVDIYLQVFLESDSNTGVEKILDILTKYETADQTHLNVLKSKLLRKLSRFDESVECFLKTIDPNNHQYINDAMALTSDVVEQIDLLPYQTNDFPKFISNCLEIAQYCERTALTTYDLVPLNQARLYRAEILIFAASKDREKLIAVENLLSEIPAGERQGNVDYLRCQARLLDQQGKYKEAAKLWAKLCRIRKSEVAPPNQRSRKWWRAKFYELHCWSKHPKTKNKEVVHTIEVLENSFTNIPPFWTEKLNALKQRCSS